MVFGLSIGPDDADRPEALLRCADLALQAAEVNGMESAPFLRYQDCDRRLRHGILVACLFEGFTSRYLED